jgi:hypothetical protein
MGLSPSLDMTLLFEFASEVVHECMNLTGCYPFVRPHMQSWVELKACARWLVRGRGVPHCTKGLDEDLQHKPIGCFDVDRASRLKASSVDASDEDKKTWKSSPASCMYLRKLVTTSTSSALHVPSSAKSSPSSVPITPARPALILFLRRAHPTHRSIVSAIVGSFVATRSPRRVPAFPSFPLFPSMWRKVELVRK